MHFIVRRGDDRKAQRMGYKTVLEQWLEQNGRYFGYSKFAFYFRIYLAGVNYQRTFHFDITSFTRVQILPCIPFISQLHQDSQ